MDLHKLFLEVLPGRIYSVSEAARYLGVHRCTVYAYISHPERPLPFVKMQDKTKLMFRGADLIAYKAAGLPKKRPQTERRQGRMPLTLSVPVNLANDA